MERLGSRVAALMKLRQEFGATVPIEEYEGAGTPMEFGDYIGVPLYRGWTLVKISLWHKENFYEALKKAVTASMPGVIGKPLH